MQGTGVPRAKFVQPILNDLINSGVSHVDVMDALLPVITVDGPRRATNESHQERVATEEQILDQYQDTLERLGVSREHAERIYTPGIAVNLSEFTGKLAAGVREHYEGLMRPKTIEAMGGGFSGQGTVNGAGTGTPGLQASDEYDAVEAFKSEMGPEKIEELLHRETADDDDDVQAQIERVQGDDDEGWNLGETNRQLDEYLSNAQLSVSGAEIEGLQAAAAEQQADVSRVAQQGTDGPIGPQGGSRHADDVTPDGDKVMTSIMRATPVTSYQAGAITTSNGIASVPLMPAPTGVGSVQAALFKQAQRTQRQQAMNTYVDFRAAPVESYDPMYQPPITGYQPQYYAAVY